MLTFHAPPSAHSYIDKRTGIIFETPLIVRREDSRGNGKNKSRKTIDTDELRCCQRFQPFLQFCEVYFFHRCWLKVFKSTQYKALYVNILCQAFLQETRSHMIYHVIKGAWGCFPNKRAMEIIGHPRIACPLSESNVRNPVIIRNFALIVPIKNWVIILHPLRMDQQSAFYAVHRF